MNIVSANQNNEDTVDINPMTEFREGVELLKNEYRERALDKLDDAAQLFGEDARLKQARSKVQNRRNPILPFSGARIF
jgi:hypothetical protein